MVVFLPIAYESQILDSLDSQCSKLFRLSGILQFLLDFHGVLFFFGVLLLYFVVVCQFRTRIITSR